MHRLYARLWKEADTAIASRQESQPDPAPLSGGHREAWRTDELSERSEEDSYEAFRDLLTADDHRARMDKRLGAKDYAAARRAAPRRCAASDRTSAITARPGNSASSRHTAPGLR